MKKNWTKILLAIFFSIPYLAIGQSNIQGKIISEENEPVPFANVVILNTDSSLVKGTISENSGHYQLTDLQFGNYILMVKMIGYQSVYTPIALDQNQKDIQLGTTQLEESITTLNEIEISAEKPMFEQKSDKMIVNVDQIVTSGGSSVLDILSRSPGVIVNKQSNTLAISGKEGVRVMINGKISRLPPEAVSQMLAGMNSGIVEKIEVITNPPASVEAEGNAGVINIVTKSSGELGTNGNFSVQGGRGKDIRYGGTLNFNFRSEKVFVFFNASHLSESLVESIDMNRTIADENGNKEIKTRSDRLPVQDQSNIDIGIDYMPWSKTTIGLRGSGFRRNWDMDATNYIQNVNTTYPNMTMQNSEINRRLYGDFNANIQQKIGENHTLNFDYTYFKNDLSNPTSYSFEYDGEVVSDSILSAAISKETPIDVYVPNLSYQVNLSESVNLDLGGKAIITKLKNEVIVLEEYETGVIKNETLSQNAAMDETIYAAYVQVNSSLSDKIQLNGGLRYEFTDTYLYSVDTGAIVDREYGYLLPSLAFNHKINDKHSWGLSYSRRISRPTFADLAPFVIFIDPLTFLTGNVAVQPSISDNIRTNYQWNSYFISMEYTIIDDVIARWQPVIDPETGSGLMTAFNLDRQEVFAIALSIPFFVTDWWEMQNNLTYNHIMIESEFEGTLQRTSMDPYTIKSTQYFYLPADITIELDVNYNSRSAFGLSTFEEFSSVNLGIQKKFKNSGSLRLNMFDIFNQNDWASSTYLPELSIDSNFFYDFDARYFMITYNQSFGKSTVKGTRRRNKGDSDVNQRF